EAVPRRMVYRAKMMAPYAWQCAHVTTASRLALRQSCCYFVRLVVLRCWRLALL
ncbi:hypothetical protein HAX54_002549, partial [Datura stramonium]|nr:hypothetical protein [Datura stramonium]